MGIPEDDYQIHRIRAQITDYDEEQNNNNNNDNNNNWNLCVWTHYGRCKPVLLVTFTNITWQLNK